LTIQGQANDVSFTGFTYDVPTLTAVNTLAQAVEPGADGIRMKLNGTNFPDVPASNIRIEGRPGQQCANIQRVSSTELTCEYPEGGVGCTAFNVRVTIAGQITTENVKLCYENPDGVAVGASLNIDYGAGTVVESGVYAYRLSLGQAPADPQASTVTVNIAVSGGASASACTIRTPTLTFDATTPWSTEQLVSVRTDLDPAFTAKDSIAYECTISHTVSSQDALYNVLEVTTRDVPVVRTLSVLSEGCGLGEYFGEFDRGETGTTCICGPTYYLPPNAQCARCPERESDCNEIGLERPGVREGYWRADAESRDIEAFGFYECPQEGACTGGNSSTGRCREGHDDTAPLCATCKSGYVLTRGLCISCPQRTSADTGTIPPSLYGLLVGSLAVFSLVVVRWLMRPAIARKRWEQIHTVLREISQGTRARSRKRLTQTELLRTSSKLQGLHLTASDASLIFTKVSPAGGREAKSVSMREVREYVGATLDPKEKKKTKAAGGKEQPGSDEMGNFALDVEGMEVGHPELVGLTMPAVSILDLPGIGPADMLEPVRDILKNLDQGSLVAELLLLVKLPEIKLTEWPGLDLSSDLPDLRNLRLPAIKLGDFPNFDASGLLQPGSLSAPDVARFLQNFSLPAIRLADWPGIALPDMGDLPDLGIETISHIGLRVGGSLMKAKLFLGFVQCVSLFPATFRTVPWPENFVNLSRILSLLGSFDFLSAFGDLCDFNTGFYPKFVVQILIMPVAALTAGLSYAAVVFGMPVCCKKANRETTKESLRTRFFELLFLIVYTLYTSVSTTIFRLYDCEQVQGKWFLRADFTELCFEGSWTFYNGLAILGIGVYTIGIPLGLYVLLRQNRSHLYADECPEAELSQHARVHRQFGAVYGAYEPHSFFFDLVDMLRRLCLTGALTLLGESSNVQIFLGGMICTCWLLVVVWRRPYMAFWDNALSAALSFQLLINILSGMALEIYRLTPTYDQDPYQRNAFGVFLVIASVLMILTAFFTMVVSVPFVRDSQAVQRFWRRCCGSSAKATETSNKKQKQKQQNRNNDTPSGDGAFAYDNPTGGGDYDDVDRDRTKEYTVTMYL
jgi:hypothetical protein